MEAGEGKEAESWTLMLMVHRGMGGWEGNVETTQTWEIKVHFTHSLLLGAEKEHLLYFSPLSLHQIQH